jgi:hypothetical protein
MRTLFLALALLLAGCAGSDSSGPDPTPSARDQRQDGASSQQDDGPSFEGWYRAYVLDDELYLEVKTNSTEMPDNAKVTVTWRDDEDFTLRAGADYHQDSQEYTYKTLNDIERVDGETRLLGKVLQFRLEAWPFPYEPDAWREPRWFIDIAYPESDD